MSSRTLKTFSLLTMSRRIGLSRSSICEVVLALEDIIGDEQSDKKHKCCALAVCCELITDFERANPY